MTATSLRPAAAFLRGAGLLAMVLAIIVGIFGMHVLTGTHALHTPAAAAAADVHPAVAPDHPGHAAVSGTFAGNRATAEQDTAGLTGHQCSESGGCTSMHTMTMACTPSAKTASMDAPEPGTLVLGIRNNTAAAGAVTGQWSYLPGSPSPCELSISRT